MQGSKDRDKESHDIIVIGGSAGAVEAVRTVVASLPPTLAAAVFVAIHTRPEGPGLLANLLTRPGGMPASLATHGDTIQKGHIYVAPPDNHLIVRPGYMNVVRGPRENGNRPSVDVLFRSAARVYGSRVIGVVLTGHQDCGTAGLISIKARGGIALVQDPAEAKIATMPSSAIAHVTVDQVLRLDQIGPALMLLTAAEVTQESDSVTPELLALEGDELGTPASVVCPSCQGVMTEGSLNGFNFFRCHVGHSFTLDTVRAEQSEHLERALWAAVRALEESASLTRRVASTQRGDTQRRLQEKADDYTQKSILIRETLLSKWESRALETPLP